MKKLLGISLVAILAATPLMAHAADGDPVGTGTTPVTESGTAVKATGDAPFALIGSNADTDGNAASAGYVKGAYNAAIKAVNTVHNEVASIDEAKQDKLTEGNGIDIDANDTISAVGDNSSIEVTASGIGIKDGGVTTAKIANGTILVEDVNTGAVSTGTQQDAVNDKLTTQGYVDQQVAGINTTLEDYATQEGVTKTITASQITVTDGKTVTTTLSGKDGVTAATTIPIMNDWSNPNSATVLNGSTSVDASSLAVSSQLGGTITASITGATYTDQ